MYYDLSIRIDCNLNFGDGYKNAYLIYWVKWYVLQAVS